MALNYDVATVCIKPYAVPMATEILAGSDVKVCAVAGFPHGNSHTGIIIAEAILACKEGATEIDIVSNTGKVLGEDWNYVSAELKAVNDAVTAEGAILKVIFADIVLKKTEVNPFIPLGRHCFQPNNVRQGYVKGQPEPLTGNPFF